MGDIPFKYLDPGIRDAVRLLRRAGIDTFDSGDGVSKPECGRDYPYPHIAVRTNCETFFRDASLVFHTLHAQYPDGLAGWGPWRVNAVFDPADDLIGEPYVIFAWCDALASTPAAPCTKAAAP